MSGDFVSQAGPGSDLVAADTGVASRLFASGRAPGGLAGRTVLLPFTTVAELVTWPERLLWGHSRAEDLCQWVDSRRMILGDETVARIWGRITVAAQRAGSAPPANDLWLAAGCLSYGLPLATLNPESYRYFADRYGLELVSGR
jgi:predicted nucleic acid-binding protein